MNLAQMRTSVRTRIGVPLTDAFYSDQNLTDIINSALQYLSSEGDWWWLETSETIPTVNGTTNYQVNVNAMRTINVIDPTGVPLKRIPFDELNYYTTATGPSARFFCLLQKQLHVRPVPNAAFNLVHWYTTVEAPLVAGTDVPLLPVQWHDALVDYTCHLAESRAGNDVKAAHWLSIYEKWAARMVARSDRYAQTKGGGSPPGPPMPVKPLAAGTG